MLQALMGLSQPHGCPIQPCICWRARAIWMMTGRLGRPEDYYFEAEIEFELDAMSGGSPRRTSPAATAGSGMGGDGAPGQVPSDAQRHRIRSI